MNCVFCIYSVHEPALTVIVSGVFLPWPGQRVCVGEHRPEPSAAAGRPRSPGGGAHGAAGHRALLPRGRGARLSLLHLRTLPLRTGGSSQVDSGLLHLLDRERMFFFFLVQKGGFEGN